MVKEEYIAPLIVPTTPDGIIAMMVKKATEEGGKNCHKSNVLYEWNCKE